MAKDGEREQPNHTKLALGQDVYDGGGNKLGEIRGFLEDGFAVTMREGYAAMNVEHVRSQAEFGEAELMWRCLECGELGRIEDGLPEECPNCGSPREDIYYWIED